MEALFGSSSQTLTSVDVLKWTMIQTCQSLDALRPLWAYNGLHHHGHLQAWDSLVTQRQPSQQLAIQFQEPEARTLRQLYAPWANERSAQHLIQGCDTNDPQIHELAMILHSDTNDPTQHFRLHEEQEREREREVACEVERERQLSRPPRYRPCIHAVHEAVRHFAEFGSFGRDYLPHTIWTAFSSLRGSRMSMTSVGKTKYPKDLCPSLLVTEDYMRSVRIDKNDGMTDDFVKPVNWVLSSTEGDYVLILSQYEANRLLPEIRKSRRAKLSIYAPRHTKVMPSFGQLDYFGVGAGAVADSTGPSSATCRALELFAGSLYCSSFEEYRNLRLFLGLITDTTQEIHGEGISNDGFVSEPTRRLSEWPLFCPFIDNPLPFLKALLHMRTRGQEHQKSHLSSIIEARLLTEDQF